jgi:hypothetical protein
MTQLTTRQLADAILRGLRENWRRMARRNRAEMRSAGASKPHRKRTRAVAARRLR